MKSKEHELLRKMFDAAVNAASPSTCLPPFLPEHPADKMLVIGAGKATINIAKALDKILDNRVKDGIIIVKYGQFTKLNNIKVFEADHPVPNQSGFDSTVKIVNLLKNAQLGYIKIFA